MVAIAVALSDYAARLLERYSSSSWEGGGRAAVQLVGRNYQLEVMNDNRNRL